MLALVPRILTMLALMPTIGACAHEARSAASSSSTPVASSAPAPEQVVPRPVSPVVATIPREPAATPAPAPDATTQAPPSFDERRPPGCTYPHELAESDGMPTMYVPCDPPVPSTSPDLSRPGALPAGLDTRALGAHYPAAARARGVPGQAFVRVTVSEDGDVTDVVRTREAPSGYGFGDACVAFVRAHGRGWRAPLDRAGRATPFRFRCTFELAD